MSVSSRKPQAPVPSPAAASAADPRAAEQVDGLHEALRAARSTLAGHAAGEGLPQESLQSLMRSFHLIKGYAQYLGLGGVEKAAHGLEERVVGLLRGSLGEYRSALDEGVRRLEGVIAGLHEVDLRAAAAREPASAEGASAGCRVLFWRLANAAQSLAFQHGRELVVEFAGEDTPLPARACEPVFASLLHAVRNCVAHGSLPKETLGVSIRAARVGDEVMIECRDSGTGIDPSRVRRQAREQGARPDAELSRMGDEDVLQLLFLPGFSLGGPLTGLSGRGFGLDIVREMIVERLGGRATLESAPGRGTRLVLRFPA